MTTEVLHTDRDGDTFKITTSWAVNEAAFVHTASRAALVKKEEAPALALALLELSGWEADSLGGPVEHALKNLAKHLKNEEARKAEEEAAKAAEEADAAIAAEEAASLDAEALAFLNAYRASHGNTPHSSLEAVRSSSVRDGWRAIAREARKVHATPEPEAAPEPPARFSIMPSQKRPGTWLLLDGEKPNKCAAFGSKSNAEFGLSYAQAGTTYFFEPLSNHL
jgi:hypothetical protein